MFDVFLDNLRRYKCVKYKYSTTVIKCYQSRLGAFSLKYVTKIFFRLAMKERKYTKIMTIFM